MKNRNLIVLGVSLSLTLCQASTWKEAQYPSALAVYLSCLWAIQDLPPVRSLGYTGPSSHQVSQVGRSRLLGLPQLSQVF